VPQAVTSISEGQSPPHACWPDGHTPLQAAFASMHAPRQSCLPLGQLPPQDLPSQVPVPPVGATHGAHDVPQVWMESSGTHPPGHWCWPVEHCGVAGASTGRASVPVVPPVPASVTARTSVTVPASVDSPGNVGSAERAVVQAISSAGASRIQAPARHFVPIVISVSPSLR